MVRLIPEFRGAIDPESLDDINELIQARIDGGISRRQLVKRAAQIGIAAPVVGVMLHATSDMAYGKPSLGRDRTIVRMQTAGTKEVTGPTAPSGTPKEGGVLVASTIEEPDTLNPWITALVTGSDVLTGVFGGLMRYDSNQQIIPDLAESFEISTDGLIYTFKLRQGVTFHDGAAFTAKDVDATWKAIMNPDFTAYSQLGWDHIKTLDMPDDFTVVMTTTEAYAPFMAYISDPVSGAIISAAIFDKGPDYFRGDSAARRSARDRSRSMSGRPRSRSDFRATTATGARSRNWTRSSTASTRTTTRNWSSCKRERPRWRPAPARSAQPGWMRCSAIGTVDVYERPNMAWSHLDLKHVDFLRITKVRQALDYATPTQDIIDNIQKGRVVRAFADQAPITTVYATDITPRPYDLEKAKQLLTEAGLTQNGDGVWEGPTPTPSKDIDPNTDRGGPTKEFKMEFWYISGDSVTAADCPGHHPVLELDRHQDRGQERGRLDDLGPGWLPVQPGHDDRLHVLLVQQQRPGQHVLLAQQPDSAGSDRRGWQRDRLLLPAQFPGQGRRADCSRREGDGSGEAQGDLHRTPAPASSMRRRSSSSGGARTSRRYSRTSAASGRAPSTACSGTRRSGTSRSRCSLQRGRRILPAPHL